jgi:hypothetical protein
MRLAHVNTIVFVIDCSYLQVSGDLLSASFGLEPSPTASAMLCIFILNFCPMLSLRRVMQTPESLLLP